MVTYSIRHGAHPPTLNIESANTALSLYRRLAAEGSQAIVITAILSNGKGHEISFVDLQTRAEQERRSISQG